MKLSDNTVLVTGGGSGIGLALVKAFARYPGNRIIICGRNVKKLEDACADNPELAVFTCDLSDDQDQQRLVEFVTQKYPEINVLVNNAGIQRNYSFADRRNHAALIEEEVSINFLAQAKLTDRLLPVFMQQPEAAIVNITSALAVVPKQSAPVYCATKAAMRNFTRALRYQLENTSVRVFDIVPALVDTEMTRGRGKRKLSPEALALEALRGIASNRYEIRIGKTKALFALHRLLPSLAERIIRNG